MSHFKLVAAALATLALATASAVAAHEGETVTPHFQHVIPNIPGKSLIAIVVDYAPGGASPPHVHANSAFIFAYVVSGAIESQVGDGPKRVYRAGESFFETPGSSHPVSRNIKNGRYGKVPDYFLVNLYASYDITDNVELSLNVDNVFDELYLTTANWNGNWGYLGPPRTYWLATSIKY